MMPETAPLGTAGPDQTRSCSLQAQEIVRKVLISKIIKYLNKLSLGVRSLKN